MDEKERGKRGGWRRSDGGMEQTAENRETNRQKNNQPGNRETRNGPPSWFGN